MEPNAKLQAARNRLEDVSVKAADYQEDIKILTMDLELASEKVRETEDEALAEMERLETSLEENVSLKESLKIEVKCLSEELERLEASQKRSPKKRKKQTESTMKRFRILYKNVEIHPRAVEGFLSLQGDLQLRAEEFIHNMNTSVDQLQVKRKVFSKKGTETAFECEFGYRGRIYWNRAPDQKTQILVIGTKNSQTRDLAYLESL